MPFNIFISCYSRKMRWGSNKENPKNYPHWQNLVYLMTGAGWRVTQLRSVEDKSLDGCHNYVDFPIKDIARLVRDEMDFFVSIDSFLPHMAHYYGKMGFVIWGQSDPNLFGYPENINILLDRKNLRKEQYWQWEQTPYLEHVFPSAKDVFEIINHFCEKTTYNTGLSERSPLLVGAKSLANESKEVSIIR